LNRGNLPIKVLIVARYATMRAGLHLLLESAPGIEIAGEAPSVDAMADQLAETRPDVVFVDETLLNRSELLSAIEQAGIAVVILTDDPEAATALSSTSTAGWGVMLPDSDAAAIVAAVHAVAAGLIVVDRGFSEIFSPQDADIEEIVANEIRELTRREGEVLQLMAAGLANKQIAARLGVSAHTVKFHVAAVLAKLGAATRAEAVAIASRRGYLMI
jgi:DNA-binding NarL/FixJ family response regulator